MLQNRKGDYMSKKNYLKSVPNKSPAEHEGSSEVGIKVRANENGELEIKIGQEGEISPVFGINDDTLISAYASQVMNTSILGLTEMSDQRREFVAQSTLSMLEDIEPKGGLETMLAVQMVAVHNMSMEVSRRVLLEEQSPDGIDRNINRSVKLMRTFVAQMEALKKYRIGGKQTIQVQHVNVNEGGQAVVGNIQGGGENG